MCTSVVVGNKAMGDGTIVVARNEDYTQNNWNKYLKYREVPAYYCGCNETNPAVNGELWTLGNGLQVPVPSKMYRYSAMPDAAGYAEASHAIGDRYFFEERGINECGVAISATNSLAINEKANKADPLLKSGGIAESIIATLLLPQVKSAREGVKLLGEYVETYGASEVNGILFGDKDEAWYFEIGSAHHWIAVKVPDDSYLIVANGMRVNGVNLHDDTVLHSKKFFSFVKKHELLKDPQKENFNFAKAFGAIGDPYNVDRVWLAQKLLTPSLEQEPRQFQYPLFLKPDNELIVEDVMQVLRATYKGTELEGIATRPIGVDRTAESHIMVLDPSMPCELQGVIWQVVSTPMGAPYLPLFAIMDEIPESYAEAENVYSTQSAYWSFRGLYSLSGVNDEHYKDNVHAMWMEFEKQYLDEHRSVKDTLKFLYQQKRQVAIGLAKQYSSGILSLAVNIANGERDQLITKITNDSYIEDDPLT